MMCINDYLLKTTSNASKTSIKSIFVKKSKLKSVCASLKLGSNCLKMIKKHNDFVSKEVDTDCAK